MSAETAVVSNANVGPSFWDILLTAAPAVLGVAFVLGCAIVFGLSKQRRLFKLLGVQGDARQTIVYLSSLFVPRGGSLGFDGHPRSYEGLTIPSEELTMIARLAKALSVDPFRNIPPILREPLQQKWRFFRPGSINATASPRTEAEIDFSTRSIITVGSQAYNTMTHHCLAHNLVQLQISHNGTAITIARGRNAGEVVHPSTQQHDIGILEKVIDRSSQNTSVVIAAGLGVYGTMGALQYLIDHWQEIYKKYGDREFALLLQFGPATTQSFKEMLKGTVIRELPA